MDLNIPKPDPGRPDWVPTAPTSWRGHQAQWLATIRWPGRFYWVGPSKQAAPADRGRNAAKRARRGA